MTQIDILPPSLASPLASPSGLELARRLIVLVPDMESDHNPAISRIWELANAQQANVLLLSLYKNTKQEFSLRRDLITMRAMVQNGNVLAEMKIERGTDWVEAVKHNIQPGDRIVCFAEQQVGLLHTPLSQILQSSLNIPLYILAGLYMLRPQSNLFSQMILWSGFLGIVIGFFTLQIHIIQVSNGGLQSILIILSLIPEFWLIWAWNSQVG